MNEAASGAPMAECDNLQRRRSPRLSSLQAKSFSNMAPAITIKRSITVRKIAPRKTAALTEHNKENTPRVSDPSRQKETKVSTPSPPECRVTPLKEQAAVLAFSPPVSCSQQPAVDAQDAAWSQKVRRSYSRLSDKSFNDSRENMFGFEKLQTPEVGRRDRQSRSGLEASGCLSRLASFTSLLEADDSASVFPEPDPNIPGVAVVKEKKRRRKVQQIDTAELDALAARMNAEFEEAEGFELVVE
ncbi:sororin [Thalassophryne amazonica]|uniref:sororin n=1 Tax=Thalassophryne amazonica TaxID=390379 RepID=UPI001471836A|nr:sororin [Thalassophryne amazonica]